MPLPNSATITGMPARMAVMPKPAATMTVATRRHARGGARDPEIAARGARMRRCRASSVAALIAACGHRVARLPRRVNEARRRRATPPRPARRRRPRLRPAALLPGEPSGTYAPTGGEAAAQVRRRAGSARPGRARTPPARPTAAQCRLAQVQWRRCARGRPVGIGVCQRRRTRHDTAADATDAARRPLHDRNPQRRAGALHCAAGRHARASAADPAPLPMNVLTARSAGSGAPRRWPRRAERLCAFATATASAACPAADDQHRAPV